MRLVIHYRDALSQGGVPAEIRHLARELARHHDVALVSRNGPMLGDVDPGVQLATYDSLFDLDRILRDPMRLPLPNATVLIGYFALGNLVAASWARRIGSVVVLNPLSQLMSETFRGKVFIEDPDVRKLEASHPSHLRRTERFRSGLSRTLKLGFHVSFGAILHRRVSAYAVFSSEEASATAQMHAVEGVPFLRSRWGVDKVRVEDDRHFYDDVLRIRPGRLNFVYWGRLDWHYKGLDRLLNALGHLRSERGSEAIPFRLFLIGPDYRGGADRVKQYIRKEGLEDDVFLLLPGDYASGSKSPLRDADASVLLSRWDGFPRSLRESVALGVPILVSPETHFGDLVASFSAGVVVGDPDSPVEVARQLRVLSDRVQLLRFQQGTQALAKTLTWRSVAREFAEQLESLVGDHALSRESQTKRP